MTQQLTPSARTRQVNSINYPLFLNSQHISMACLYCKELIKIVDELRHIRWN